MSANDVNATKRPSPLITGVTLSTFACTSPALFTLARVVVAGLAVEDENVADRIRVAGDEVRRVREKGDRARRR